MAPLLMQVLRDKSRSTIIYFLFSILIIVFIFTFNTSGSGGCGSTSPTASPLATVGEKVIDVGMLNMGLQLTPDTGGSGQPSILDVLFEETRFYYLDPVDLATVLPEQNAQLGTFALLQMLTQATSMPVDSPAFAAVPQLKYAGFRRAHTKFDKVARIKVFNDLVENSLIGREATNMGLVADPKAVEDRILDETWFDSETKEFRRDAFKNFLNQLGVTAAQYSDFVTNEILREKVIEFVAAMTSVGSSEVDRVYKDINEKVVLEYVEVNADTIAPLVQTSAADIAAQSADKDALKKYYDSNKKDFVVEATTQIRALLVGAPTEKSIAAAKDAKIKGEMAKAREDAKSKAESLSKTMLATVNGPEADPYDARKKAFIEAVKSDSSDDTSKRDDGLYKGAMTALRVEATFGKEVASAVKGMKKGDISAAIATSKGFWVVFAEDTDAGKNVSLKDATQEIAGILAQQKKAPEFAKKAAKELLAAANKAPKKSLKDIVAAWNDSHRPKAIEAVKEVTPGGPKADEPPTNTKDDKKAVPEVEPVVDTKEKAGAKSADEKPTRIPGVAGDTEATEEAAPADFAGMLSVLDSAPVARANSFPEAFDYAREQDDVYRDEDDLNKYDTDDESWTEVLGLGRSKALKTGVFALTSDKPVYPSVFNPASTNKHFVVRLKEQQILEGEEATDARSRIRRQLLARRQREAYRAYYSQLLKKSLENGGLKITDTWNGILTDDWTSFQGDFKRAKGLRK